MSAVIIDGVCRVCKHAVNPELRHCIACHKDLPLVAFGVNGAYRDGIQPYCKDCIWTKVKQGRVEAKQRQERHKQLLEQRVAAVQRSVANRLERQRLLSHVDRVRDAIDTGAHRLKEIVLATTLSEDEVETALCRLQLETKEVASIADGYHERLYFLREAKAEVKRGERRSSCSLVQLVSTMGPVSHGVSARRSFRVENRERSEGLEPSRRSRVA